MTTDLIWKGLQISQKVYSWSLRYEPALKIHETSKSLVIGRPQNLIPFFSCIIVVFLQATAISYILLEATIFDTIKLPIFVLGFYGFVVVYAFVVGSIAIGCVAWLELVIKQYFNKLLEFEQNVSAKNLAQKHSNKTKSNGKLTSCNIFKISLK